MWTLSCSAPPPPPSSRSKLRPGSARIEAARPPPPPPQPARSARGGGGEAHCAGRRLRRRGERDGGRIPEVNGFEVVASLGLGYVDNLKVGRLGVDTALEVGRDVDRDEADAVVLACTNWVSMEAIHFPRRARSPSSPPPRRVPGCAPAGLAPVRCPVRAPCSPGTSLTPPDSATPAASIPGRETKPTAILLVRLPLRVWMRRLALHCAQ